MEIGPLEILIGFATFVLLAYYYFTWTFDFWKNKNVKGPTPSPVYGNFKEVMMRSISMGDLLTKYYQQFPNEPLLGIFARRTPILVVQDAEQIKNILIKDFTNFVNRGIPIYEKIEPLSSHLFMLEAERWRPLRHSLSPVFTSGKLKEMFYLLQECADHFSDYLDKYTTTNSEIECRELTAKFTTDVIGVCAFGLKMNALDDENSQFRKMGREIFNVTKWKALRMIIRDATPWLFKLLGPLMYEREMNEFFIGTITETMNYRKENNIKRNDFVDLLVELRENPKKLGDIECTDALLTAQAFVFFLAGFETSSTTISHTLYEMALNPSIQKKLREEILEKYREVDNEKLKYQDIKDMKYLHKVFCETLRKYPPVTVLMRQSLNPYTFKDLNVTIPAKQTILIPAYAIQRDPKIYPDPDTFDPERFTEEQIKQRHPSYYLPFGDGPRNCIGARFANYQSKIGIITVLKNFEVQVCEKTCIPYVNDPKAFLLSPLDGLTLKFVKLKN